MAHQQSGVFTISHGDRVIEGERRREPRVSTRSPAVAVYDGKPHRYRLRDVSLGGALLDRPDEPPPPTIHTMILRAGGRSLKVLARTVWMGPGCHGVRFVAQSDVDRLELGELIDRLRLSRAS
jgi:hypothetical protein